MWKFWIDVGGTFTDCLAVNPSGEERLIKVLSSGRARGTVTERVSGSSFVDGTAAIDLQPFWINSRLRILNESGRPVFETDVVDIDAAKNRIEVSGSIPDSIPPEATYELDPGLPAPVVAVHLITATGRSDRLPAMEVHLGTTRGTNALLTRNGAPTAFVTTAGMKDLLTIGDQSRPDLFKLNIQTRARLFETVVEIDERILHDGTVERSPRRERVHEQMQQLKRAGIESVAIALMFGFRYPQHEILVADCARQAGLESVCLSSVVAPLIKILPRAETTVLDAYLNPVIDDYLNQIESALNNGAAPQDDREGQARLRLMTSSGGLVSRSRFSGKDSVLSGPAGGVVGAARCAQQASLGSVIGFDMGGTSTDVSRYDESDGRFELDYQTVKAGVRIVTPMMAIETVAAGGGSICRFDSGRLIVGPQSAGADPGPACYGRGGPLTVTDLNLKLGRICPAFFPMPLDHAAVDRQLEELGEKVRRAGHTLSKLELAEGLLQVANHTMATAIKSVSIAKGYDPREYALVAFGGAGSQHACAVAGMTGISRIFDHPHNSILSAVGIRLADRTDNRVRSILRPLDSFVATDCESVFRELRDQVSDSLLKEGADADRIAVSYSLDLRYAMTDEPVNIAQPADGNFRDAFEQQHRRLFGYLKSAAIEVVNARVSGSVGAPALPTLAAPHRHHVPVPTGSQTMIHGGTALPASLFRREDLEPGDGFDGPALVVSRFSTTVVDPGWSAVVLDGGQLLLERTGRESPAGSAGANQRPVSKSGADDESADPVQLEIFNNHFSSIAQRMGISLRKTSTSVNVKERLDFSCALFTAEGDLVVNAPHIPVHLGAMSESVRGVIAGNPDVQPGDVFVTNDPYAGGSHLPDVTVVSPVYANRIDETPPTFWVASRSHHAEIGGKSPGSMPPDATRLGDEGVIIRNFKLISGGRGRFDELSRLLTSGDWPSRSPDENLADIEAQVASNRAGESGLQELVRRYTLSRVEAYMRHIRQSAAGKAAAAIRQIADGEYQFADSMDNGSVIRIRIVVSGEKATFDFTGTDPPCGDNLNANRGIVLAAIMYVMRCLIDDEIPLNEGMVDPVELILPACFLNPTANSIPDESPAMVGGNVETSQRVVDVLLGALGLAAASQGTMNNWLMGNESFGYYETLGGGSGATADQPGASAVHTHMTNTLLTDPEVMESRYPTIVREFAIRKESGGAGVCAGGCGMIREIEFTDSLTVSLLTSRRGGESGQDKTYAPFGLAGGGHGLPGRNTLLSADGNRTPLPARCKKDVRSGDRLRMETPGGGGWGDVDAGRAE